MMEDRIDIYVLKTVTFNKLSVKYEALLARPEKYGEYNSSRWLKVFQKN